LPGEVLITTGRPRPQSWQRLFWPEALTLMVLVVTAPAAILSWWTSQRRVSRHRYWLTNTRLVVQEGLIGQQVRSVPLSRIVDVTVRQNWLDRIFGITNLDVRDMTGEMGGPGPSRGLQLFDVTGPDAWKQEILSRTSATIPCESNEGRELGQMVSLLQQLVDRQAV
jgi:uncharacterized membrane protein YdbT with pleckstrin-like domain